MASLATFLSLAILFLVSASANLGITFDDPAAFRGNYVWSSIIDIKDGTQISNEDLKALAKQAYEEMIVEYTAIAPDGPKKPFPLPPTPPTVMVALLAGDKLYFASSLKRSSFEKKITNFNILSADTDETRKLIFNQIVMELYRCQSSNSCTNVRLSDRQTGHANSGSCGEIMSTLYWSLDRSRTANDDLQGARIVAVNSQGNLVRVVAPCIGKGTGLGRGTYGCREFASKLGLIALTPQIDGADINQPPPTLALADPDRGPRHETIVCPRLLEQFARDGSRQG
jgi:hypothetical protein